jgi:hypothetical protein
VTLACQVMMKVTAALQVYDNAKAYPEYILWLAP